MSEPAVLPLFNDLVDRFCRLQGFIDKANALAGNYSPIVVQRVVEGHTASRNELLTEIVPMMIEIESAASDADGERQAVETNVGAARAAIEELELRKLIGDLDDEAFAAEAAPHEAKIADVASDLDTALANADALRGALRRWQEVGESAGVLR